MLYLTLRHYEYVTAIARHGSLSGAAQALHVSQPALSTALSRIEAHLGRVLFLRRKGAPLELTPAGRDFVARADSLLAEAARLEQAGTAAHPPLSLTIGCFSDLAPFLIPRALGLLRATLPHVQLDVFEGGFEALIAALKAGTCDLALTYDLGLDSSITRTPLYQVTPRALMPPDHRLAQQPDTNLAALAEVPLILSRDGLSSAHMMQMFKSADLVPQVAYRVASLELLRSMAARGEGVGLAYSLPASDTTYDGMPLASRPLRDPQATESVVLSCHATPVPRSTTERAMSALAKGLAANSGLS
ncbi:LysR family transcriptional regulator [Epibacterium sp. Ofav1-8]|uniref:LysR family transcriptional regulator n=1 Tax=Epibacterium sp. Ofav1-8 TaxID=2917735 RepID=UPI001EF51A41|nr:LysR family transcriptional regulator [Epibacterium sp. Ofav1-8]MCG7622110.1 LysR family transcriptional regulator [Epibacterium sp. Ofav1-8]